VRNLYLGVPLGYKRRALHFNLLPVTPSGFTLQVFGLPKSFPLQSLARFETTYGRITLTFDKSNNFSFTTSPPLRIACY
jgi:hypothetical protein